MKAEMIDLEEFGFVGRERKSRDGTPLAPATRTGWKWTIRRDYGHGDVDETTYRTNYEGEGLWVKGRDGYQQTLGTCQFSLPANQSRAAWAIRRHFKCLTKATA